MNNIDELIERLQKIASWMDQCAQQYEDISYHHQAEDINDAITALREQQERIAELGRDKAFYKSCALSGEIPLPGSEPSAKESGG